MKKIFSCFCLVSTMILFASCQNTSADNDFLTIYSSQKEIFDNAQSTSTVTSTSIVTDTSVSTDTVDFSTTYDEIKNDDGTFEAYTKLNSDIEEDPLKINLFFKDNTIYSNNSLTDDIIKMSSDYDKFKSDYSAFYFLDIESNDILNEKTSETDNETIFTLTLDQNSYPDLFESELYNIESVIMIDAQLLDPKFSDINYIVKFNENDELTSIDISYDITLTISIEKLFGEYMEEYDMSADDLGIEDEIITRSLNAHTDIAGIDNVEITYPENLEDYTALY